MPSERQDFTAGQPCGRTAEGLLTTDSDERVLLVEPEYQAVREMPGECVEADKASYQVAVRVT